jgi:hypothetical protein
LLAECKHLAAAVRKQYSARGVESDDSERKHGEEVFRGTLSGVKGKKACVHLGRADQVRTYRAKPFSDIALEVAFY